MTPSGQAYVTPGLDNLRQTRFPTVLLRLQIFPHGCQARSHKCSFSPCQFHAFLKACSNPPSPHHLSRVIRSFSSPTLTPHLSAWDVPCIVLPLPVAPTLPWPHTLRVSQPAWCVCLSRPSPNPGQLFPALPPPPLRSLSCPWMTSASTVCTGQGPTQLLVSCSLWPQRRRAAQRAEGLWVLRKCGENPLRGGSPPPQTRGLGRHFLSLSPGTENFQGPSRA